MNSFLKSYEYGAYQKKKKDFYLTSLQHLRG